KKLIHELIGQSQSAIFFVSGGTQANQLVISHLLRPYQSVIAVDSGHIHVHEAGAIENSGHKINAVPHQEGKISVQAIREVLLNHPDNHIVMPKLVYLSQCTELGTIYSKNEMRQLFEFCQSHDLLLFVDGARLGTALTADDND